MEQLILDYLKDTENATKLIACKGISCTVYEVTYFYGEESVWAGTQDIKIADLLGWMYTKINNK